MKLELDKIVSIAGKPGLYKVVSPGSKILIVEPVSGGKRIPIHQIEAISSLDNIAIYTYEGEVPLREIFYKMHKNPPASTGTGDKNDKEYFKKILPEYDEERVYNSHIKKVIKWYRALSDTGFDFDSLEPGTGNNTDTDENT